MRSDDPAFEDVFARARAGDSAAWNELFSRLGDEDAEGARILRMARDLLPPGDRARDFVESRDLIQSALRSGWFHAEDFRGSSRGELYAWIRAILRRKLGRVVRKKQPRPAGDGLPETSGGGLRDVEAPFESLLREEIRAKVRAAVDDLPEDQRVVMKLRLEGMGAPDIAGMLGLSAEAVRKRESRAAAELRKRFGVEDQPS
jgi:RNA polymerase sigma factor (sigma-70 family)